MKNILFSPIKIASIEFKNRILMSPMCQYSAIDGMPNEWHTVHYLSRAIGGVGGIIIEATAIEPRGRITPKDLGLWNDKQKDAFSDLICSIKKYDCKVGIQLGHAGRKGSKDVPWKGGKSLSKNKEGWQTLAPSPIAFDANSLAPKEADDQDLNDIISYFQNAAKRATDAGADFVEIHMAHGYLLHEFLSPLSNKRNDKYGGNFENRCRFPLNVAKAVREIIPKDIPLFVRISATDWQGGGWDLDQSVQFIKMLKSVGVDSVDVSSGGLLADIEIPEDYGYHSQFSYKIKQDTGVFTLNVGTIINPYQAEQILNSNQADMVVIGRALLHNPYWVLHAAEVLDQKDKIQWPNQYLRAAHLKY